MFWRTFPTTPAMRVQFLRSGSESMRLHGRIETGRNEFLHECFIHHRRRRALGAVESWRQETTAVQRNSENVEVASAHVSNFGEHDLIGRIGRLTGDVNIGVAAPVFNGKKADYTDSMHAGNLHHAVDQRLIKIRNGIAARVARWRQIDRSGEYVVGIEAEIDMPVTRHHTDQQAGNNQ